MPERVEGWLTEMGLQPLERAERDGVHSWDLLLDGRKRRGVRFTLILDPALALLAWVHYAPPLTDNLRRTYRLLLRWNDELPLVKFAVGEDDRPVLGADVAIGALTRDTVGLAVARLLAVCDLVYAESAAWVDRLGKPTDGAGPAGERLLERYADQLAELAELAEPAEPTGGAPNGG